MRYVHFRPNAAMAPPEQIIDALPRRRSAAARVGSTTGWTDDDVQELLAASSWSYVSPSTVPVGPAAPGDVAGSILHLLHVGFSLSVPERCRLTWVRFVVQAASDRDSPSVRFVSLFPHAVYRETVFAGPIVVDDEGMLTRETSEPTGIASNEVPASPLVIGFVAAARSACWDFTPFDGRPPTASDRLVLAVSRRPDHDFVPRQQLFVNVFDPDLGGTLVELTASMSA